MRSSVRTPSGRARTGIAVAAVTLAAGSALLAACSAPKASSHDDTVAGPMVMQPANRGDLKPGAPRQPGDIIDLTQPGAVVWQTAQPTIENTGVLPMQRQITEAWRGPVTDIEEVLEDEDHERRRVPQGPANNLPVGGINPDGIRPTGGAMFPGIGQTPWTPPDPTLAVGPNHVLATVNMAVAWWTKTGTLQFSSNLDNTGNPGFFESVGCGNFTFDPKCFYDHYAGRFVIIAPEVYGSTEAWLCIAVSDDSDPNGTWYKYRTNMVVTVGNSTYWLDYPGFGYDQQGYYITGNLFGLNTGGTAGTAYRIFNKTPLLSGQPAQFSTLRDGSIFSVQVAQCFGSPAAPFFVAVATSSSLRVQAITNPLTAPALVSTTVSVPSFSGPGSAPAPGGSISMIDGRILNVHWRNGNLYATHDVSVGGLNAARWYHLNTNNWPTSGSVSLVQSGNVAPGGGKAVFFPAIYSNKFHDVGLVVGASSSTERVSINVVGRRTTDPTGTMGPLTQLYLSPANNTGRWGDYQDIAMDPSDDTTFWVVGETSAATNSWGTWIDKFTITTGTGPYATDDLLGNVFVGEAVTVDVLANDGHSSSLPIVIHTFDATSQHGGTVVRSVGTGPGGRDELIYTPPTSYTGSDTFNYTIKDTANATDNASVLATVLVARDPENPSNTAPELASEFYATTTNLSAVPDFTSLTPYLVTTTPRLNQGQTLGQLLNSTRSDRVAARFTGYVEVPATDLYTFYLSCDDGANMYVGNTQLINHDGSHTYTEKSAEIALKAGKHAIRVEYFENTGWLGLTLSYASSTISKTVIPASALFHLAPCPADFDGSGFVDIEDYTAFVIAFEAGEDSADFDGSGFVDIEDFTSFVLAFEAGC
ncbi:MAG: hypothetical protein GIKADHBN_00343 [Phycisphaerales bacterium]|nr:hypothetical protein [Phycisphaerales bacterium]